MSTTFTHARPGVGIDPRGPQLTAAVTAVVLVAILLLPDAPAAVLTAVQAALRDGGAQVAIGLALVAALPNAVFRFCLGCELYLLIKRATA